MRISAMASVLLGFATNTCGTVMCRAREEVGGDVKGDRKAACATISKSINHACGPSTKSQATQVLIAGAGSEF